MREVDRIGLEVDTLAAQMNAMDQQIELMMAEREDLGDRWEKKLVELHKAWRDAYSPD